MTYRTFKAFNGKGPELLEDCVSFNPDEIIIGEEQIPISSLKVIDTKLDYKDRFKGRYTPPSEGTGSYIKLKFLDEGRKRCHFYVESGEKAEALEMLLSEMKKKHPSLILMKF